MKFVRWTLN